MNKSNLIAINHGFDNTMEDFCQWLSSLHYICAEYGINGHQITFYGTLRGSVNFQLDGPSIGMGASRFNPLRRRDVDRFRITSYAVLDDEKTLNRAIRIVANSLQHGFGAIAGNFYAVCALPHCQFHIQQKNTFCVKLKKRMVCNACETAIQAEIEEHQTQRRRVTPKLRYQILARDNFTCQLCGNSPNKNSTCLLAVDHIIPASKGGKTTPENLRSLCADCNAGKGDALLPQVHIQIRSEQLLRN